jgi:predicted ABC-type transport system involved in lysophospholipase L1 biosynthesis ATPase subunit
MWPTAACAILWDTQQSLGMAIVMVTHRRRLAERLLSGFAAVRDGTLISAQVKSWKPATSASSL